MLENPVKLPGFSIVFLGSAIKKFCNYLPKQKGDNNDDRGNRDSIKVNFKSEEDYEPYFH